MLTNDLLISKRPKSFLAPGLSPYMEKGHGKQWPSCHLYPAPCSHSPEGHRAGAHSPPPQLIFVFGCPCICISGDHDLATARPTVACAASRPVQRAHQESQYYPELWLTTLKRLRYLVTWRPALWKAHGCWTFVLFSSMPSLAAWSLW